MQSLTPPEFAALLSEVQQIATVLHRHLN
jgi:hypothetical protein